MTVGGLVTAPLPAVEVERARVELRLIVDEISTLQHKRVEYEDGTVGYFTAPPLVTQVEREMVEQSGKAGSFTPRSKPPLWIDGEQFLIDVDEHTARHEGADRAARVRAWSAATSSSTAAAVVDGATLAYQWRATISNLLEPRPKMRLRGQACPNCKAEKVWDRHDDAAGENHARPALEIDAERGVCTCRHCEETWAPEYWEHLGQVLRQQQEETLAVTGWDASVHPRTAGEAGLRWCDVGPDDLAVAPSHAVPSARTPTAPQQCTARIPVVHAGEPLPGISRRCPALLDRHGACYLADRHVEPDVA